VSTFPAQEHHRQSALVRKLWPKHRFSSLFRHSIATVSNLDECCITATVLVDGSADGVGNVEDADGPS
jgi:hypothetical protein